MLFVWNIPIRRQHIWNGQKLYKINVAMDCSLLQHVINVGRYYLYKAWRTVLSFNNFNINILLNRIPIIQNSPMIYRLHIQGYADRKFNSGLILHTTTCTRHFLCIEYALPEDGNGNIQNTHKIIKHTLLYKYCKQYCIVINIQCRKNVTFKVFKAYIMYPTYLLVKRYREMRRKALQVASQHYYVAWQ